MGHVFKFNGLSLGDKNQFMVFSWYFHCQGCYSVATYVSLQLLKDIFRSDKFKACSTKNPFAAKSSISSESNFLILNCSDCNF